MNIRLVLLLALTALPACDGLSRRGSGPSASHETFDERSGNTLLAVAKPILFARGRTDVTAHARDYATLVAVEVDHSGDSSDYVLLYRWSTVDPRMAPPPDPQAGKFRILADGRVIDLVPLERLPIDLAQRRDLHLPDRGSAVIHAYAVDPALLHFIATSRVISVQMPQETLDTPFTLWEDGRQSLAQFLRQTAAS
jgi:hypothetical protein